MGRDDVGNIHEELGDVLAVLQRLHLEAEEMTIEGLTAHGIENRVTMHSNGRHQLGQLGCGRNVRIYHGLE